MVEALQAKFPHFGLKYSIGGQISFDVFPIVSKCTQSHATYFLPRPHLVKNCRLRNLCAV